MHGFLSAVFSVLDAKWVPRWLQNHDRDVSALVRLLTDFHAPDVDWKGGRVGKREGVRSGVISTEDRDLLGERVTDSGSRETHRSRIHTFTRSL